MQGDYESFEEPAMHRIDVLTLAMLTGSLVGLFASILLGGVEYASIGLIVGGVLSVVGIVARVKYNEYSRELTFEEKDVSGQELIEQLDKHPTCGDYILTRVESFYSPEGSNDLKMVIDMPGDNYEIFYEMPYNWGSEKSGIVEVLQERGIGRDEIHEFEGEPLLVRTKEDSETEFDVYNVNPPERKIQEMYDEGEIEKSDVASEAIRENFDIELPWDESDSDVEDEGIIADDGAVYTVVDKVR